MSTTNFPTVRLRVLDVLYADRSIVRGTATGGSTSTVVDSSAALPGATTDHFDYAFIKITTTTDGNAPQGEVRAISEGGYTVASGTLTTSAVFTAAVASGDTYEIHYGPHPNWLDRLINKYARNFHFKTLWPLTLHIVNDATTPGQDDNNMEDSGTTAWTAVNVTLSKSTAAFNGAQSLSTLATAADGYAEPDNDLQVDEGKSYYAAIMCAASPGPDSGYLQIWDTDNNAAIDASDQVTQETWTEIVIPWTPPSGCRSVEPRLRAVNDGDQVFWDDYQIWSQDGHIYPLPFWITRKEQIKDVVVYPLGTGSIAGDVNYRSNEHRGQSVPWRFEREDYGANEEIHIWVPSIGQSRPYVLAERPIAEVSFDYGTAGTGTTANTIPIDSQTTDLLVSGILSEAFRELASKSSDGAYYREQAAYHANIWDKGMQELKPREHKMRSNRIMVQQ